MAPKTIKQGGNGGGDADKFDDDVFETNEECDDDEEGVGDDDDLLPASPRTTSTPWSLASSMESRRNVLTQIFVGEEVSCCLVANGGELEDVRLYRKSLYGRNINKLESNYI